jgi:hypothetical protein
MPEKTLSSKTDTPSPAFGTLSPQALMGGEGWGEGVLLPSPVRIFNAEHDIHDIGPRGAGSN